MTEHYLQTIEDRYYNIPEDLKDLKQWCCYKLTWDEEKQKLGKYPKNAHNGGDAKANDESTWCDFDTAIEAVGNFGFDGLGFFFKAPYVGVDIDDVENDIARFRNNDHENNIVSEFVDSLKSYTEVSVSGTGIHIICEGELPPGARRKGNVEMYDSGRFFVMTGDMLDDLDTIREDEFNHLGRLHEKYLSKDEFVRESNSVVSKGMSTLGKNDILTIAPKSKNGNRFESLFKGNWENFHNSQSDADLAFCNMLAFWTGCDYEMMESIFIDSGLMRDKWYELRGESTYGYMTLTKAINDCVNVFEPSKSIETQGVEVEKAWWEENKNGTVTFKHNILADAILKEYAIVRYPDPHSDLYYYNKNKGIYEQDKSNRQINSIIRKFDKELKNGHIKEVYQYIADTSKVVNRVNSNYIALKNGILNLLSFELEPFNPNVFVLQKIKVNYNPGAYDAYIDDTLNKVTKGHIPSIENIKEMFGCVLYPGLLVPKMFYLYGRTAHNGKSSILNMIHNTFNRDGGNISAISPQKLATNTFAGSAIFGKMANVVDDQPDQYIEDSGILKSMITGGYVEVERKGKDSETVHITTTMITASNFFPNMKESGNQITRRFHIIPFEHNFSLDENRMTDSESMRLVESESAREYVLKLAVDALKIMLNTENSEKLTFNEKSVVAAEIFNDHNDPLADYLQEYDKQYFEETQGSRVLDEYEKWCQDNRVAALGTKRFKESICTHYDMDWKTKRVTINGESKPVKGFKAR